MPWQSGDCSRPLLSLTVTWSALEVLCALCPEVKDPLLLHCCRRSSTVTRTAS